MCGGVCALRTTCRSNDDEIQPCNIYVDFLHLGARNLSGYANDRCLLINLPLKYEHHHIAARDENLQEPSMYLWVLYCHLQANNKKNPGLSVLISPRDQIQMFRREEHAFTTCTSH